jgi:7-cyano-7-deazaguanine reductase
MTQQTLEKSNLGKKSIYTSQYDPTILFALPRQTNRIDLGISAAELPFTGTDRWYAYELSWLNHKGKPNIGVAQIDIAADSLNLIESKSLKLYLNSLNNSCFASAEEVIITIQQDLDHATQSKTAVKLISAQEIIKIQPAFLSGWCIDHLDISIDTYDVQPNLLKTNDHKVKAEILHSHLLKSNCLITSQPDWGSLVIEYSGPKIIPESLLAYIVSYRNHCEFHENCIERIFVDLMQHCQLDKLALYGCYTRRGGLDINPFRSNHNDSKLTIQRHYRQ